MSGLDPVSELPPAKRVLAVCAHPDDESFGLGGILATYAAAGAAVGVVCLTRGEASTLGAGEHDLLAVRADELVDAAEELGVTRSWLADYPDGGLEEHSLEELAGEVRRAVDDHRPDAVVAFHIDGVTGHADHRAATRAALQAVAGEGIPLLQWYVPAEVAEVLNREFGVAFPLTAPDPGDLRVRVDRERQRRAIACHRSQHGSLSLVGRRLELLGPVEHLRPRQE